MSTLLLPEMKEDLGERASGVWLDMSVSALGDFANYLSIDDTIPGLPTFNCLPDIWAQLLQFEFDLAGSGPLAADSAVMWRTLLTLWAIAPDSGLPVTISKLASFKTGDFLKTAGRLLPSSTLINGDSWESLGIVHLAGQPVAVVNPSTLLAPSVEAERVLREVLPSWFSNGRLVDPTSANVLTPRQKTLVRDAVTYLVAEINRRQGAKGYGTRSRAVKLMQLLTAFRSQLDQLAVGQIATVNTAGSTLFDAASLVSVMERRFGVRSVTGPTYWLPARAELQSAGVRGLIVVDVDLARTLGVQPEEVSIWKGTSLAQALSTPADLEAARSSAAADGYLIVTADELFTPNISKGHFGDVNFPAHPPSARTFVLPLTPFILAFMSPGEVKNRLEIIESGGTAEARLQLPLRGTPDGHTVVHKFTRVLGPGVPKPAACAVWPDVVSDDWKAYFLLSDFERGVQVCPTLGLDIGSIAKLMESKQIAADRTSLLRNLDTALPQVLTRRLVGPGADNPDAMRRQVWLQAMAAPPEAVLCDTDVQPRTAGGDRVDPNNLVLGAIGFILFPTEETAPDYAGAKLHQETSNAARWTVGIDFGTTNTTIYHTRGDGAPDKLTFKKRLVSPYDGEVASDPKADGRHILLGVIGKPVQGVFQTIQQSRSLRGGLSPDQVGKWGGAGLQAPVWSHRVMFNSNAAINLVTVENRPADIVFGDRLKWDIGLSPQDAAELTPRVEAYLRQVVLQSLAEAAAAGVPVASVAFRFSFPGAFGPNTTEAFKAICASAVREATGDLAQVQVKINTTPLDLKGFESNGIESRCAALFFLKVHKAFQGQPVVLFDVGGGTTDFSIVRNKKVLTHSSLKFAGRDIFLAPLLESGLVQNYFKSRPNFSEILRSFNAINDKQHALEMIVNAPELLANDRGGVSLIDALAGAPDKNLEWLKGLVTLAYGGLIYYAGTALAAALGQEARAAVESESIRMAFGGRGSLMFASFVPKSIRSAAAEIFKAGAGLTSASVKEPIFSEKPKEEVAYGLLCDEEASATWDDSLAVLSPLGEKVSGPSGSVAVEANYRSLITGSDWRIDLELPNFKRFLKTFQERTGVTVAFAPEYWREIADAANGAEDGFIAQLGRLQENLKDCDVGASMGTLMNRRVDAALRAAQPPFLLALRAAIGILVQLGPAAASSATRISLGK